MSLSIYMDVHVPTAITRGLRRRGVDVLTSQQDGTTEISDDKLLDPAFQLGRVLFTRDQDLLAEAAKCLRVEQPLATVIFARQLDVSIGQCVTDLEIISKSGRPEENIGQVIYLPL